MLLGKPPSIFTNLEKEESKMAVYFKCPNCGEYFADEQGEHYNPSDVNCETFICPECNGIITLDDTVKYDIKLFYKERGK